MPVCVYGYIPSDEIVPEKRNWVAYKRGANAMDFAEENWGHIYAYIYIYNI